MTHEQTGIIRVVGDPLGAHANQLRSVHSTGHLFMPLREALKLTKQELAWDEWEQVVSQTLEPGIGEHPANQRKVILYGGWGPTSEGRWPSFPEHQEALRNDIIQHLVRTIEKISKQASKANWDSEDALPVAPETAIVAKNLVRVLPAFSRVPDVSASPDGDIEFDWAIERHVMLTVSVCGPPEHDILFVANMEKSEFRGKEPWENKLPQLVKCCFERMKGWL